METSNTVDDKMEEAVAGGRAGKWVGWLVIILALAGLGICLYLYSLHVALLMGELKSGPLCGTENGFDCHAVTAGPYGSLLGFSLASWGALFYIVMALLGLGSAVFYRDRGQAFLSWALILAAAGVTFDLYLAYTMVFEIGAVCWLCVSTYVINLFLVVWLAVWVGREPKPRQPLYAIVPWTGGREEPFGYYRDVIKAILAGIALLSVVVVLGGSQFLSRTLTEDDRDRVVKINEALARQDPQRITEGNGPAMGTDRPKVTVVEFSDFRCPFCEKASKYIKLSARDTQDVARFVFRHYPLDTSCNPHLSNNVHPGACLLAEGAVCADEQDKFWRYHDLAFAAKGNISLPGVMAIAAAGGIDASEFQKCLASGRARQAVLRDIEDANRAGIKSTPTLSINGRLLRGVPKSWMLSQIVRYFAENLPQKD